MIQRNSNSKRDVLKIYITVDHLKDGPYQINILHQNKVIKKISFKK